MEISDAFPPDQNFSALSSELLISQSNFSICNQPMKSHCFFESKCNSKENPRFMRSFAMICVIILGETEPYHLKACQMKPIHQRSLKIQDVENGQKDAAEE